MAALPIWKKDEMMVIFCIVVVGYPLMMAKIWSISCPVDSIAASKPVRVVMKVFFKLVDFSFYTYSDDSKQLVTKKENGK